MEFENKAFKARDCQALLEKYFKDSNFELKNYTTEPISSEVNGYLGEHLLLKIFIIRDGKRESLKFFLKTLSTRHKISMEFVISANMFNKEINGYKFIDQVKKECPCFDAECVPYYYYSMDNTYIILQELYSSGFKLTKTMNHAHIKLVVRAIAKFHAGSLMFEETRSKNLERRYSVTEDYSEWLKEAMYRREESFLGNKFFKCGLNAILAFMDYLPESKLPVAHYKNKIKILGEAMHENFQPSKRFRNVWCNGNLWLKNVMFRYKDEHPVDCKVFDFQLQRYNPPAHDLCDFLVENVARNQRQHYWEYYIDLYYNFLTVEMEGAGFSMDNIFSRDELHLSCVKTLPFMFLVKSTVVTFYAIGSERYEKIEANTDFYIKMNFVDRADYLLDVFKTDENYKKIVIETLQDVTDQLNYDHLSTFDCFRILRQKLGSTEYRFLDYKVFSSDKKCHSCKSNLNLSITISTEEEEERELFFNLKLFPKEEHRQIEFTGQIEPFFKEMRMYAKIIPYMKQHGVTVIENCIGKCYLSLYNEILVFDDFSKNNYKSIGLGLSFDYATVLQVAKKLAQFHASTIVLEEKLGNTYEAQLNTIFEKEFVESTYNGNNRLKCTISQIKKQILLVENLSPQLKASVLEAFRRLQNNVAPSETYRNVMCHGNLWPKTILVKQDYDNSVIDVLFTGLDSYRYNTPAHDLISFLYQCTDRYFRDQHMKEALKFYYREISEILKHHNILPEKIFTNEQFMLSCQEAKEFALTDCVIHLYKTLSIHEVMPSFDFLENEKYLTNDKKSNLLKKIIECFKDFEELYLDLL